MRPLRSAMLEVRILEVNIRSRVEVRGGEVPGIQMAPALGILLVRDAEPGAGEEGREPVESPAVGHHHDGVDGGVVRRPGGDVGPVAVSEEGYVSCVHALASVGDELV